MQLRLLQQQAQQVSQLYHLAGQLQAHRASLSRPAAQ
jgi:hypothetical protein